MLGGERQSDLEREADRRRLASAVRPSGSGRPRRGNRAVSVLLGSLVFAAIRRLSTLLLAAGSLAAVPAGFASAAPPAHPELNPLFAAEWWLRGHTTLVGWSGEPSASDGVDAVGAWVR